MVSASQPQKCMEETTKSWFISDLHLLARRSSGPALESRIHQAARQAHTFVLGGDIFDFRWRTQRSFQAAIHESIGWLKRLIENNSACEFYYLLGNHDSSPEFVEQLQQLAAEMPQLAWHRHLLRIDTTIFLHGDIVDRPFRPGEVHHEVLDARRLAGEQRSNPSRISHALYDAVVGVGLHRVAVHVANRKLVVLQRLTEYLQAHDLGAAAGIENVFFGHTHRRLVGVPYGGLRFYNPGAAIKGLKFDLLDAGLVDPRQLTHPGSSRKERTGPDNGKCD